MKMKNKMYNWFIVVLALAFFSGCVATASTMETRSNDAEGNYTVESTEVDTVAAVGEPYVGPGTPWFYFNDAWYLNGIMYGYYGGYGWWPYGYYGPSYLARPNHWYGNPHWNNYYRNNPHHGQNFQNKYHGGTKWHGRGPGHPGIKSGTRGGQHGIKSGTRGGQPGTIHRGTTGTVNRGVQRQPQVQHRQPQVQHRQPQVQQRKAATPQRKSAPATKKKY
jgi:hypothetical protein